MEPVLNLPRTMRYLAGLLALSAAGSVACNDPFGQIPATLENRIDTLELFAVNGTDINRKSGFLLVLVNNLDSRGLVRIGIDANPVAGAPAFDFLYRIDAVAGPQFAPYYAVAPLPPNQTTSAQPGLQTTQTPFAAITEGQQVGYTLDKPINLAVGTTLYARSALPNNCFLSIPYYAKIEILSFDEAARSVKFIILANRNCGYRGLEPGIPKQ